MSTQFQLLPQAGGYLVHVFLSSTSQVRFSIDFAHRIQSGRWPRLRNNRIRLRFPSETTSVENVRRLMDDLQQLADTVNAHRQRKRARFQKTCEGKIEEAGSVLTPGHPVRTDEEVATAGRSRKLVIAHVQGPEKLPVLGGSLFCEWAVLLENFDRSLGSSWPETAEYLARRLAGRITECCAPAVSKEEMPKLF